MHCVFISHAREDQATAAEVCALLEARGVSCWIAPRDVAPGAVWDEAILDAIESTRAFVLVLSARANASVFVKNEVNRAFSQGKPMFAFRIEDVQPGRSLELYLARHHWTDGFPPPLNGKIDKLAAALKTAVQAGDSTIGTAVTTTSGPSRPTTATLLASRVKRIAQRVNWRQLIPAVLVTAALAGIVGRFATRSAAPPTPTVTRFSFTLPDDQRFTYVARSLIDISPDGTLMVYEANRRLYVRSLADLDPRVIPWTEDPSVVPSNPVFSPDGRSIAFLTTGTLKKIPVGGGAAATLCAVAGSAFGMTWSKDGILFGHGKGVMRVSANGGTPEMLLEVKSDEVAQRPEMLPDGETVLFTLATGSAADRWDKARVVAQNLKSGARKVLIEGGSDARYLPTSHLIYALSGVLYAIPFDLPRLEVRGAPVRVVEGVRRAETPGGGSGAAQFGVSATGSAMYIPGAVSASTALTLGLFDQQGAGGPVKIPPGPYETPRISPDGKHIAFAADDGKDAVIWIYDRSGTSAMRRLTFQGRNRFPIWSSDAQHVVFQSDREGDLGIFWQPVEGSGLGERLTRADQGASHVPESWSSIGDRLLFSVAKDSKVSLWMRGASIGCSRWLAISLATAERH